MRKALAPFILVIILVTTAVTARGLVMPVIPLTVAPTPTIVVPHNNPHPPSPPPTATLTPTTPPPPRRRCRRPRQR